MESASVAVEHGHGPPDAHQSSRIDRQTLGIMLLIVSEVLLFGAFFASYFFLRVVANVGPWPPDGFDLPKAVAGVNTAILISSSFTVHWALESIRRGNRRGVIMGLFIAGYGVIRISLENVREPDSYMPHFPLGLTMGMMLSAPMVLAGAWMVGRGLNEPAPPPLPAQAVTAQAAPAPGR